MAYSSIKIFKVLHSGIKKQGGFDYFKTKTDSWKNVKEIDFFNRNSLDHFLERLHLNYN